MLIKLWLRINPATKVVEASQFHPLGRLRSRSNAQSAKGKMPKLAEGVGQVPAGVARILELQEQGYAYIRP